MVEQTDIPAIIACLILGVLVCVCSMYCLFVPKPTDLCCCIRSGEMEPSMRSSEVDVISDQTSVSDSTVWDSDPPSYTSSRFGYTFPVELEGSDVTRNEDSRSHKSTELPSYYDVQQQPERYKTATV